jgi:hypothetical protein
MRAQATWAGGIDSWAPQKFQNKVSGYIVFTTETCILKDSIDVVDGK